MVDTRHLKTTLRRMCGTADLERLVSTMNAANTKADGLELHVMYDLVQWINPRDCELHSVSPFNGGRVLFCVFE